MLRRPQGSTSLDLDICLATRADLDLVASIYADVGAWLHDVKGIADQWPRRWGTGLIERLIAAQVLHMAYIDEEPVATMLFSSRGDVWDESDGPAMYVGGLAVRRSWAGMGVGSAMLQWCTANARRGGYDRLRLDCVASNGELQAYYVAQGFGRIQETREPEALVLFEKSTT